MAECACKEQELPTHRYESILGDIEERSINVSVWDELDEYWVQSEHTPDACRIILEVTK